MVEFSAVDWAKLSTNERIKACRVFAAEAEKLARVQLGGLGNRYKEIARQWLELAKEIEAGAANPGAGGPKKRRTLASPP